MQNKKLHIYYKKVLHIWSFIIFLPPVPKIIEVDPHILKGYTSKNMPNTASAIRRVRRVVKQTAVNRIRKSKYRAAVKKMEELVKSGEKEKIKIFFHDFQSILMQVAKTGTINKNTASRKISKISKKISKIISN